MDAFYASVEQRDNPDLKGKPVAVGGMKRGVVASASYEARLYGIRSAMPSALAIRKCPQLIFVKSNFDVYRSVSKQIRAIFHEYTDLVEPLSLDEAYLDVTQNKKDLKSATIIANQIRQLIYEQTQLTASAGVSINKFVAKIASDVNKPNGIKVVNPHEVLAFLEALPIEKFHGIGKVTAAKMKDLSIYNGKDLKRWSEYDLVRRFGKMGRFYYKIVRGEDHRPVNPNRIRKSVSVERTFNEDLKSLEEMEAIVEKLAIKLYEHIKKINNYGRTITLKVKFANFEIITRSRSFASYLTTLETLKEVASTLLKENYEAHTRVRLLGLGISNLQREREDKTPIQLEIPFED